MRARKRISFTEMRYVAIYLLVPPAAILTLSAIAVALPASQSSMGNIGPHGLSEVVYAFTSNVNVNAGRHGATTFYNLRMSLGMLVGRYVPIIFVLALAGSLARHQPRAVTRGSLAAEGPTFIVLVVGSAMILALLNFLPVLSLGPIAEGLRP